MTYTSSQPDDFSDIPISSDYSPQNNAFYALPGAPGGYLDAYGNTSSPAVVSFSVPLTTQENIGITGAAAISLAIPFKNNNIAGNSIIVSLGLGLVPASNIALSVADTAGNTYQQAVPSPQGNGLFAAIFYATRINFDNGAPNVVTIAISGSGALAGTSIAATIYEVPGLIFAANALDQVATGSSSSSLIASTSAITPVAPNSLAIMAVATGGTQITPATGWTADSGSIFPVGDLSFQTFSSQSQLLPTIASVTPQASLFPATSWCAALATFRSIILPIEGTVQLAPATNAPITSVAASTSSVPFLAVNAIRKGLNIFNESTAVLYLAFAPTAKTSAYTTQIPANSLYEMPQPIYPGAISGLWTSANGFARITELS